MPATKTLKPKTVKGSSLSRCGELLECPRCYSLKTALYENTEEGVYCEDCANSLPSHICYAAPWVQLIYDVWGIFRTLECTIITPTRLITELCQLPVGHRRINWNTYCDGQAIDKQELGNMLRMFKIRNSGSNYFRHEFRPVWLQQFPPLYFRRK